MRLLWALPFYTYCFLLIFLLNSAVGAELRQKKVPQSSDKTLLLIPGKITPSEKNQNIQGKIEVLNLPINHRKDTPDTNPPDSGTHEERNNENTHSGDTADSYANGPASTPPDGSFNLPRNEQSRRSPKQPRESNLKKNRIRGNTHLLKTPQSENNKVERLFNKPQLPLFKTSSGTNSQFNRDVKQVQEINWGRPEMVSDEIIITVVDTPATYQDIIELGKQFKLKIKSSFVIHSIGIRMTIFSDVTDISATTQKIRRRFPDFTAQPNYIYTTLSEPLDHMQVIHQELHLDSLHDTMQGEGTTVAVIDTGVAASHQDLLANVSAKKNFIYTSPYSQEIHGTGVAGLIAAEKNVVGISGLAPKAKILALRACQQIKDNQPEGQCFSSSIVRALDFAIQNNADIINMSLGAAVSDPLISRLIVKASEKHTLLVAPAGNDAGQTRLAFPALHPFVISVAGVDRSGKLLPNEKTALLADLYVPSTHIFTTLPDNRYNFLSGTSFSTAVVSGLLALSLEKNGEILKNALPPFTNSYCAWAEKLLKTPLCHLN